MLIPVLEQTLPSLEEVVLHGNPLQKKIEDQSGEAGWGEKALAILPNLRRLDGIAAVSWRTKITAGNELVLKELFDKMDADGSGKQPCRTCRGMQIISSCSICTFGRLSGTYSDVAQAAWIYMKYEMHSRTRRFVATQ